MASFVIYALTLVSLQQMSTVAVPFSHFKIPCHTMPGSEITRLNHVGQAYSLHEDSDAEAANLFDITEDGVIRSIEGLSDYADRMFSVVVEQFLDNDSWKDSFNIYISDGSDSGTTKLNFELDRYDGATKVSLGEDTPQGTIITTIKATAPNPSAYRYVMTNPLNPRFHVQYFTGEIILSGRLNRAEHPIEEIYVEITNIQSKGIPEQQKILVTINPSKADKPKPVALVKSRVRRAAPVFEQTSYEGEVLEVNGLASPVPPFTAQEILTIQATGSNVQYNIVEDAPRQDFDIGLTSGILTNKRHLDREEGPLRRFKVRATNSDGSSNVDVLIKVRDVNDNAPEYVETNYNGYVVENGNAGVTVMTMEARDQDDLNVGNNAVLTYFISRNAKNENSQDIFQINSQSAVITTQVGNLDRETYPTYEIVVTAVDGPGLSGTATATIHVTDVNDNPPTFLHDYHYTEVSENARVGSSVYKVKADDRDEGGENQYSIIAGNADDKFYIEKNPSSGQAIIKVFKNIDFENDAERYNLVIQVDDSENSASTTLEVKILDVNDNEPVFEQTQYSPSAKAENVPLGTSLEKVVASDQDKSQQFSEIEYDVVRLPQYPDSSFFSVDSTDGIVRTIKNLDREPYEDPAQIRERYIFAVIAKDNVQGEPGELRNTATATVTISIYDVNDNPPEFKPGYSLVVPENTAAGYLAGVVDIIDRDTLENGPPFTYTVENNAEFDVTDSGEENQIQVVSKKEFDREATPFYYIPVVLFDRDSITATQTLTVTIGDKNDNPPSAATKNILVYSYKGQIPRSAIGEVYADDADAVKGEDIKYTVVSGVPQFSVEKDTGQIIMEANTKAGIYEFTVEVHEQPWDPVVCTVIVEVKDIPEEAVYSSGSVRLFVSAERFIRGTPSLKEKFHDILVDILGAKKENIDIFSVINVADEENQCDVRWSAHGSPYYRPEQMNTQLLLAKGRIENELNITMGMVPIDLCLDEGICESSCTNYFNAITDPTVIDDGKDAFVSVTTIQTAECVCGAKLAPRGPCSSNPCLNGGTCIDTPSGYVCECDAKYVGTNCEDTSRSFSADSFAWYPPLSQCEDTKTSIEFMTENQNGILLYNGPITAVEQGQPEDYIAIELVGGKPRLYLNLGSGILQPQTIENSPALNDEKWHTLEVIRQSRSVEFIIDNCRNAVVTENEGSTDIDDKNCKVIFTTSGENRFLNVNTPLQLGGLDKDPSYTYPSSFNYASDGDFQGCIRNVIQDSKVYDLGTPGVQKNTEVGCPKTDVLCYVDGEYVCKNGKCVTVNTTYHYCVCDPGWSGQRCDQGLSSYDFAKQSFVNYTLEQSLIEDEYSSNYQIMVGNKQLENAVLMHLQNNNGREYITLKMKEGNAVVDYNLGDADRNFTLTAHNYSINDGNYHTIQLTRFGNSFRLEIDGGGGVRTVEEVQGAFKHFIPDHKAAFVGANVSLSEMTILGDDYSGCAKDARISNQYIGFDGQVDGGLTIANPKNVKEGCDICSFDPCIPPQECVSTPSYFYCSCPAGWVFQDGACVKLNTGEQVSAAGLSLAALLAILACIFVLLVLILVVIIYKRRSQKEKSGLVFDVDEDDLRENAVDYDDEGGGEEDYDGYDINTLRKPLDPALESRIVPMTRKPVEEMPRRRENVPQTTDLPDIAPFLTDRKNDADYDPDAPPYDTLRVYSHEGDDSSTGSLSSLNTSSSAESDQDFDYLKGLGEPFKKLADMYSGDEG